MGGQEQQGRITPCQRHRGGRRSGPEAGRRISAWVPVALLLVIACAGSAGCGEARVPARTTGKLPVDQSKPKVAAGSSRTSAPSPGVVARIDASSDAVLAEGKLHIAPGAPSDAEVRREINEARKAGIVLPSGESAASFENAPSYRGGPVMDAETPEAPWNPRSKPIADWIIPVLQWAYLHGWRGTVTSGYRTRYEQAQLNAAGAFSAPAGLSNHETTVYPGGAVDVTSPSQLITVLRTYPGPEKLVGGVLGPVDPEHFSATGG
jgi:hypothetical protein